MKTNGLRIAVVMISHNQCDNLKVAVDSVLKQSRQPDQIVVLDDGSTDATRDFLKELQRTMPNLLSKSQPHYGIGKARKAATSLTDSDIVVVLDSDDVLFPTALACYENIFMKNPNLDLAYGNVAVIKEDGQLVNENRYRDFKTNEQLKKAIFVSPKVPFKHSAMAFRKNSYLEVGGYNENCKIKVDIDLMLRFIDHHKKIMHVNETIAEHRIHQNNISRNRLAGLRQWYRFIFKYERNLFKRIRLILIKTFWELSKMIVETIRNLNTSTA